jgi:hypothetical protein
MTQPTPNLRETKRQQAAAKKAPAKNATVTPLPVAEKAAAKAAHPASAAKQPAKKAPANKAAPVQRELSRVAPLPKPAKLEWTEKDGVHLATSGRWRYRVSEGSRGWFAEQATGSWTPLHGDGQTVEQAKRIAEIVDAGAHWCGWAKYRTQTWAEIEKAAKEAGE